MSHTFTSHGAGATPSSAYQAAMRPVALGVILWGIGVATVHFGAPIGMMSPAATVPLFAATLPLVWVTIRLVRRVASPAMGIVEAVGLATAPAVLLDSAALTWMPTLYSGVEAQQRATAGWLLWFVGLSLILALWQASRVISRSE